MDLVTLDFETFYDQEYSLSKMTTEAYIRDPRFETILMGYKINDDPRHWVPGPRAGELIQDLHLDQKAVLCHHSHFDGFILSHHYDARPAMWFDTLSMARALHGTEVGGSLKKLLDHYQVGVEKGTYVLDAKGKRLADFTPAQLKEYAEYCKDDVEGTYRIFMRMLPHVPKPELRQIDWVTRMFTEPRLYLDEAMLVEYLKQLRGEKVRALLKARVTEEELQSAAMFAAALERLGVKPPQKTSPTTGKPTYAFAKTDYQMQQLLEDEDPAIQALVAARLKVKSTHAETRTIRMIDMAPRGPAPMYYKYAGAGQTMRLAGGDSMNWQNLTRGSVLRDAIYCDEDSVLLVIDSSNIEARTLDFLAMQEDAVESYRLYDRGEGPDIYCVMASRLYQREITLDDNSERQLGKVVKLACLAGATRLLTNRGIIRLDDLKMEDFVWDGTQWVTHQGLLNRGVQQVEISQGVGATPEHMVLTDDGWQMWHAVHTNPSRFQSALDSANLPFYDMSEPPLKVTNLSVDVPADGRAWWQKGILKLADLLVVTPVQSRLQHKNAIGDISRTVKMMGIVADYVTGLLRLFVAVIAKGMRDTNPTERVAYVSATSGERTKEHFLGMSVRFPGGITRSSTWTGQTINGVTSRETFSSYPVAPIIKTNVRWPDSKQHWTDVYDIAHAGPRNRFTILSDVGPLIVHNCGYQMGAERLMETARNWGIPMDGNTAQTGIEIYRQSHPMVVTLWQRAHSALPALASGPDGEQYLDGRKIIKIERGRLVLPNGLAIKYPGLKFEKDGGWSFDGGRGRTHIYGGKIVEQCCQALARIIVMDQTIEVNKRYPVVMHSHDELVALVPEEEADEALAFGLTAMRTPPKWAPQLPVNAKGKYARRYGEAK